MQPPIFYASPEACHDKVITLDAIESHHAVIVMRLKPPAQVVVVDGLGKAFRGEILSIRPKTKVTVGVHSEVRNFGEPTARLTLAAGLSTNYKFDSVIQKGTELGVKRFVPIISEKSKVKIDEPRRAASKQRRLEKVALAAIKQCRRAYRPDISLPTTFADYLAETDTESPNLLFHPSKTGLSLDQALPESDSVKRVSILVGPESGFSDDELEAAMQAGFVCVSLGDRILRTETAGPAACALVMHLLGELR